jgi:hypothetical protein
MRKKSVDIHNNEHRNARIMLFILLPVIGFFAGNFVFQNTTLIQTALDRANMTNLVSGTSARELAVLDEIKDALAFSGSSFTNTTVPGQVPILLEGLDLTEVEPAGSFGITQQDQGDSFARSGLNTVSEQDETSHYIDKVLGLVYITTLFDATIVAPVSTYRPNNIGVPGATILESIDVVIITRNENGVLETINTGSTNPIRIINQGDGVVAVNDSGDIY